MRATPVSRGLLPPIFDQAAHMEWIDLASWIALCSEPCGAFCGHFVPSIVRVYRLKTDRTINRHGVMSLAASETTWTFEQGVDWFRQELLAVDPWVR
mmetsp:Transcript_58911/g.120578  ORF Transcript_58911/g.120578 Transcript_58911/m.120578 type:complete len:97 (+) Transcript_58911:628-918(+)